MRNGSSNLSDSNVLKGPDGNETYWHFSKVPKFVLATGKHQKKKKKSTAAPAVLRNGCSNPSDSNVPKGPGHNKDITQKFPNMS